MKVGIWNKKVLIIIVQIVIFILMICFFSVWCPLTLYDADDWKYISYSRIPLPMWKGWNPSRVLPETLMPLAGKISGKIASYFSLDFVYATTIVSSIICASTITLMCYLVFKCLCIRKNKDVYVSLIMEILFFIGCFLIFRNRSGSRYLFNSSNVCCVYFYIVPGVLNATVILFLMQFEDWEKQYRNFTLTKKILFYVIIYFCIFSNLFHSGMLVVYISITVLTKLYINKNEVGQKNHEMIYENKESIFIILMWIVAVIFELSGGRAGVVGNDEGINIILSIKQLVALIKAMNKFFLLLLVACTVYTLNKMRKNGKSKRTYEIKENNIQLEIVIIFNIIILSMYELALNAKVKYMSRIEASWGIWFYCILFITIVLADIMKNSDVRYILCFSLLDLIMLILAVYPDGKFMPSNIHAIDYQECLRVDHLVQDAVISADLKGDDKIVVFIPDYVGTAQEWAFGENYGQLISDALYTNGVIRNKVEVITKREISLNK